MYRELLITVFLTSLCTGVSAASCSNDKSDPHRCDKVIDDGLKCFIYNIPSRRNCSNNATCIVKHKVCYQMERVCTPKCCENWGSDENGLCSVDLSSPFANVKKSDISTIVSGLIVGILFIILLVMTFAMFRICRARSKLRRRLNRSPGQNYVSSVFTVYNNEPPPYEVVISTKPPEYTPRDEPPSYDEQEQSMCCETVSVNMSTNSPNLQAENTVMTSSPGYIEISGRAEGSIC